MTAHNSLRRFLSFFALTVFVGLYGAPTAQAGSLNCVQFVERNTAFALHGDAWRWCENAAGQYGRGNRPRPGAVMVFSRSARLPFGHVAKVRSVQNNRTILVDHANWSPIDGRRGQVETAVAVLDVSPKNDWSAVRVWYRPSADFGQKSFPVRGFVYPVPTHQHRR